MAAVNETTQTKLYCTNHPQTETLLRCNKCGRPMCLKCVQRTPVGYRCKECLGQQRAGYYTANTIDHIIAPVIAFILGAVGAFGLSFIGGGIGFFGIIIAIFAGPIAGGIVAEIIRRISSKRRGRYIALLACSAMVLGALIVAFGPGLLVLGSRAGASVLLRSVLNITFWVFLAVAVSTLYARLRA